MTSQALRAFFTGTKFDCNTFDIQIFMMFVFLSVSIRCLTKGKLKKRKHIFLKQYDSVSRDLDGKG